MSARRAWRVTLITAPIVALTAVAIAFAATSANRDGSAADGDPLRVVTLGGSVTEIAFALGAGERVVAVDESSHHPVRVEELPRVGNFRSIPVEGVLALEPDLVITTADAGPVPALAQLRDAGVRVEIVPVATTLDTTLEKIRGVAAALALPERGDALAGRLEEEVAEAVAEAQRAPSRPRVLFVYARGAGALFVGGRDTAADEIIRLAGGVNAVASFDEFRPLTAEAVVAAEPDVILIPTRGLESVGGEGGLLALPGIAQTPAGRSRRIARVDDTLLIGFGPRLADGVRALAAELHPELAQAPAR